MDKTLKDVEDTLCRQAGELQMNEEGTYFVDILDQELDTIRVYFNYDDGVKIECADYNHLCLHAWMLEDLANLVYETTELYENQ